MGPEVYMARRARLSPLYVSVSVSRRAGCAVLQLEHCGDAGLGVSF
jgi:hypothetical protein